MIGGFLERWTAEGRTARLRHLKPRSIQLQELPADGIVSDPHGKPPRSTVVSVGKICYWLIEEWWAYFFQSDRGQLLVCDRYYHDLLVDPRRYRYGGPMGLARLIGRLMPQPGLWILLDAPSEVLQARKQEVTRSETERQCQAYRLLVRSQQHFALVDAAHPLPEVVAQVTAIIGAALSEQALNEERNHG